MCIPKFMRQYERDRVWRDHGNLTVALRGGPDVHGLGGAVGTLALLSEMDRTLRFRRLLQTAGNRRHRAVAAGLAKVGNPPIVLKKWESRFCR